MCLLCLIASTDYPTIPGMAEFVAGPTSEMTVELSVLPDSIFETNETYVLTLFVPRSDREQNNLELLDTKPVVTIINDDSKLYSVCVLHP